MTTVDFITELFCQAVGFVGMRLRKGTSVSLPAGVAFYAGTVEVALDVVI